jgi:hypothetical protein
MQRTAARGPRDETKKFTNNLNDDLEFEPNHKKNYPTRAPTEMVATTYYTQLVAM